MPMTYPEERTARLNMRIGPDALAIIREAAIAQRQDITGFVLGAALERARGVVKQERALRAAARGTASSAESYSRHEDPDDEYAAFGPELAEMVRAGMRRLESGEW
jgi:uncharacterized protein (DUF1778 family)